MPNVQFTQDQNFEPIPGGIYDARLTDKELKSGGQGPYYNCQYTLEGEGVQNRKIWKTLSLAPQSLWAFKQDMVRLGINPDRMAPGVESDTDEIIEDAIGESCRLKVSDPVEYPKNDGTKGMRNEILEVLAPAFAI